MTQEILPVSNLTNYLRFVDCCSGAEILFRGTYPIVSGQVLRNEGPPYDGFGGQLQTDACYTVFLEYTSDTINYPPAPTFGSIMTPPLEGCDDLKCASCIPPSLCQCPPGFIEIAPGICEGEESILPTAPEIPLYVGEEFDSNSLRGLLSWGSINGYTFPILCTPQGTNTSSLSALTPIPNSGTNNITGDSWIGVSPPPQPGGNHAAITTASPVPYPNPNPLLLPINTLQTKPYRESNINAGILEYGQGSIISHTGYAATPFWVTWYNSVAVWQETSDIEDKYAGFNVCVEPPKETRFQIVITGNNGYRIIIDDNLAVEAINGDGVTPSLAYANNFEITLQAGVHNIRVECYNYSGNGGLACEILVCTYAVLAGITNLSQLVPYRVFSTLWKRPRPQSLTANGTNIVTAVSGTQPYDLGGYFQMSGVDPNIYITNVINATTYQVSQVIPFGTFNGIIRFIYNASNIEDNSYTCPDGYTLINCDGLACVRTIEIILECDCYLIIPCDGSPTFISSNITLANYVDGFHTVISPSYTGCAYIIELVGITCEDAEDAYVDPLLPCECDLLCYYVSNSNGFLYVDINNESQQVSSLDAKPYVRICSKIYPIVENSSVDYEIINIGPCEDGECPVDCFKLTNCETDEVIYTLSQALIPYVYGSNNVVNILNREGCWTASVLDEGEICDCPIDIIVTASYATCEDCIPVVSYKLTSCINNDVIYTLDDLEIYVGQTVKLDCGCYNVHQLDIIPPNPQSVVVEDVFIDCIECLRTYWILIDCNGVSEAIYTYTDLTLYENKVIKIEGCDTCWKVESTDDHINPITVTLVSSFDECIDCKTDLPCLCSKMTNVSDLPVDYAYLDCEHNLVDISLDPGVSTDKICAIQWYKKYCNCFILEITINTPGEEEIIIFSVTNTGELLNGYPVYSVCDGPLCTSLFFNGTNWVITDDLDRIVYILQTQTSGSCPLGIWVGANGVPIPDTIIETYAEDGIQCLDIPFAYVDLFYTDYVEYFGECKEGVCPPPVFKNNRSVRPGYNTPNCNPDEYDKITCRFSQVMYKVVLEKRYGITNCCLDEDEKWLLKKELIDLQALKDPNYICSSFPCSCNSGKSYSSCNCRKVVPVCSPPLTPIPITSYNCTNGACVMVLGTEGQYPTLLACQTNCTPPPSYNCVPLHSGSYCVDPGDGTGLYNTIIECENDCLTTYNCVNGNCVPISGPNGEYPTLVDCENSFIIVNQCIDQGIIDSSVFGTLENQFNWMSINHPSSLTYSYYFEAPIQCGPSNCVGPNGGCLTRLSSIEIIDTINMIVLFVAYQIDDLINYLNTNYPTCTPVFFDGQSFNTIASQFKICNPGISIQLGGTRCVCSLGCADIE
jgi:hypothetical protein